MLFAYAMCSNLNASVAFSSCTVYNKKVKQSLCTSTITHFVYIGNSSKSVYKHVCDVPSKPFNIHPRAEIFLQTLSVWCEKRASTRSPRIINPRHHLEDTIVSHCSAGDSNSCIDFFRGLNYAKSFKRESLDGWKLDVRQLEGNAGAIINNEKKRDVLF